MKFTIRPALKSDEPLLWRMLYFAAHMDEEGSAPESAKTNPDLAPYVEKWTERAGDLGFIAVGEDGTPAGAAWIRVMPAESPLYRWVAPQTPELAIAVAPEFVGQGVGTELMRHLPPAARAIYPAFALSVRANNPAKRLYERFGFATVARITNRVGTQSFVMLLQLRQRADAE